jgi:hypothetical protein
MPRPERHGEDLAVNETLGSRVDTFPIGRRGPGSASQLAHIRQLWPGCCGCWPVTFGTQ